VEHIPIEFRVKDNRFFKIFYFLLKNLLDDLELPDGSLSNSVTNFANGWRTDSTVSNIKL